MSVLPTVKQIRQIRQFPRLIRQGLPRLQPGQGWFVASSLVNSLGSGLFYPFAVLYFHQVAGLSLPLVGLGLTVATGLSLATVPAQGALVDRVGARSILIAAHLLRAGGFLAYLLVHSFPVFLLLAALVAIGSSTPAGSVLVAEIAAPEDRDRWFGLSRVLVNAGLGAGGLLGGVAVATGGIAGYQWIVVLNALSFVVAAGMVARLRMPAAKASMRVSSQATTRDATDGGSGVEAASDGARAWGYWAVLRDRPFLGLVGASVLLWMSIFSVDLGLAPYVVSVLRAPAWIPGVLFGINTSLIVLAQVPVMGLLASRRRTRAMMAAGLGYAAVFLCLAGARLVPASALLAYLCATMLLSTAAELILAPSIVALAAAVAPASLRGRYLALSGLSGSAAMAITPLLATALLAARPAALWLTLAPLMVGAAASVSLLERRLPVSALRAPAEATSPQSEPRASAASDGVAEPCLVVCSSK